MLAIAAIAGLAKDVTTMRLNLLGTPLIATFFDVQTAVVCLFASKLLSDVFMMIEAKDDEGSFGVGSPFR